MTKTKVKIVKDKSDRWLLTYSDLMNLLLIFFIVLYTMSQVDQQKVEQLSEALKAAFGQGKTVIDMHKNGNTPSAMEQKSDNPSAVVNSKMEVEQINEVKNKIEGLIAGKSLQKQLGVVMEERGIRISISSTLLFQKGKAQIDAAAVPFLDEVGNVLKNISEKNIRVEGHTDNDPINTNEFHDNWELSSMRANEVLKYLVQKNKIKPEKISAVGFGEYRPIVPNTSEENKSKNRRVDIVILKSMYDVTEPGY
jgi:chemotaxis protein MotB